MTYQIRRATSDDIAAIAELHAESLRNTYRGLYNDAYLDGPVFEERASVWRERMSTPPGNLLVVLAEDDGGVVGFACAYGRDDERLGTRLDNLHVRLDRQGGGVGRRLVAEVARWSHENYPEDGLYLGVLEKNARARRIYQQLAAADAGPRSYETPGGGIALHRIYTWTSEQVQTLAG